MRQIFIFVGGPKTGKSTLAHLTKDCMIIDDYLPSFYSNLCELIKGQKNVIIITNNYEYVQVICDQLEEENCNISIAEFDKYVR